MSKLIGTNPNQVPSNADLGTAAFMDKKEFLLSKGSEMSAINAIIAKNFNYIFVYDTSLDSDGGAWRKSTSHTSWYNEPLNTAIRGKRREFPSVVVIAVWNDGAIIYDADDPTLPMWMIFEIGPDATDTTMWRGWNAVAGRVTHALNARVCFAGTAAGLHVINFRSDESTLHYANNDNSGSRKFIGLRNQLLPYTTRDGTNPLTGQNIHSIDMKVVPNATVDVHGLPVPSIAVGVDSAGACIVHHTGEVFDLTNIYTVTGIKFTEDGRIWSASQVGNNTDGMYLVPYPTADTPLTSNSDSSLLSNNWSSGRQLEGFIDAEHIETFDDFIALGANGSGTPGLTIYSNEADRTGGVADEQRPGALRCQITKDFNTGFQPGRIRLATLADTDASDVDTTNILANWSTASAWTKQPSITITWTGTQLSITGNGTGSNVYFRIPFTVEPYTDYIVDVDIDVAYTTPGFYINNQQYSTAGQSGNIGNLDGAITFNSGSNTTMYFQSYQVNASATLINNIQLRKAVSSRTIHNTHLMPVGNLKRTPVAPGAELVAYSGFTNDNTTGLYQPYKTEFNFGTGDFTAMIWLMNGTDSNDYCMAWATSYASASGNPRWGIRAGASDNNTIAFNVNGSTVLSTNVRTRDKEWQHVCFTRRSGVIYGYVNGKYRGEAVLTTDLTGTAPFLRLGNWTTGSYAFTGGSITLAKVSTTGSTADQISRIYDYEKELFKPNAKATLYGSSDVITGVAFDKVTKELHVGTSSGRSVFNGIERKSNTTKPVTVGISAANGLVAEE
jgi:hypothetical protein